MKSNDAILIALLVVLVIVVVCWGGGWMKKRGRFDGFTTTQAAPFEYGTYNPYTVLNQQLSEIRGYRNDGYNQKPFYELPQGLDRYHRSGADIKPEEVSRAERDAWYFAPTRDHAGTFNTELIQDPTSDTMQFHDTSVPDIDYGTYITDLIIDPRTKDNHQRWVEEMRPWSGTATTVDTFDVEPYIDFIGLRRPQAVVQFNPLQLTEVDTYDISGNHKFNFQG
jgi:hypothetical protein